jgi:hypothetical protein
MRSLFTPECHAEVTARLRGLSPATPRRWGTMTAPQMVAHLTDQMRHALGDVVPRPIFGPLRWPFVRFLSIYVVPWPKGRVKGPPDAFVSRPGEWQQDLETLNALLDRFVKRGPTSEWPPHALFGPMSGKDWGYFCYKHFDHHLRQFGQ